ncbi:MAG: hypothetical protein IPJ95_04415 [Gemmatimonadetes bacterium]|nr:hypothetical protein [Gemmatimonadota bacterium]
MGSGIDLAVAASCPGWEWKVEAMLHRHGLVAWEAPPPPVGVLEQPVLATA